MILTEEETKDLTNLKILVNTRNALSNMTSHCLCNATSQIMSQATSLIDDMDKEIERQRKEFYAKAVQNHFTDIMKIFIDTAGLNKRETAEE